MCTQGRERERKGRGGDRGGERRKRKKDSA